LEKCNGTVEAVAELPFMRRQTIVLDEFPLESRGTHIALLRHLR